MTKAWNHSEKFGEIPFDKIILLKFKMGEGINTRDEAAFLQYNLLVKKEILRCHLDFFSKKGELIFNPLDTSAKKILDEIQKQVKVFDVEEVEMKYEDLLNETYHLD